MLNKLMEKLNSGSIVTVAEKRIVIRNKMQVRKLHHGEFLGFNNGYLMLKKNGSSSRTRIALDNIHHVILEKITYEVIK